MFILRDILTPLQEQFIISRKDTLSKEFRDTSMLIITDSGFGNDGLFKPMHKIIGKHCHLLSRLRVNSSLFDLPPERDKKQRG